MRKNIHIFHQPLLLLFLAVALLNACSADRTDETAITGERPIEGHPVAFVPYVTNYVEKASDRRAAPIGFTSYTPDTGTDMGIYALLPEDWTNPEEQTLRYIAKWLAYFSVDKGKNYIIYGYMPKMEGMSSTLVKDEEDEAVLTITGITPVMANDICIVTGVKNSDTGLKEGSFYWSEDVEEDDYYVFMLMDHLYAGIQFRLKVQEEYSLLRSIKLKSMTLKTDCGNVTATIDLTHNTTGGSPVTSTSFDGESGNYEEIIFTDEEGTLLSQFTPTMINACFAPQLSNRLTIVTTYDVYDRKGNLIREDCTAENKLPNMAVARGERMQVNLTIAPSYLYQLSDPELDNPSIEID